MKTITLLAIAFSLASCGTGTSLTFGEKGITVTLAPGSIIIPTK